MNKKSKFIVLFSLFLCLMMVVGCLSVRSAKADETAEVWYGDVNDDGKIDAKDVTMLRRQLAGGWNVTINEEKSDVNQDEEINAKDVTMLRRYLAGGWGVVMPEKQEKQYTIEKYIGDDFYFHIRKVDNDGNVIKETLLEFDGCRENVEYQYDNNRRISGTGHDENGNQIKVLYEDKNDVVVEDKTFYNNEGEESWKLIQEYDKNGNIVKRIDVTNDFDYSFDYLLDNNGRISVRTQTITRKDGSLFVATSNYSYDTDGNTLKIEKKYTIPSENENTDIISWDYSSYDKVIAKHQYSDGEIYTIEYDKKWDTVELKWNDGEDDNTEKYYFDADGKIIKYQWFLNAGLRHEDLYSSKEKVKQWISYDDQGKIRWSYEYSDDGSLLKYCFTDEEGKWIEIDSVPIDEKHFPDEVFREYILTDCDTDKNGILDALEIQRTEYLDCNDLEISDLKGVEVFGNLKGLSCKNNKIEELDLSKVVKLETLWCSGNQLTSLNVNNNSNLLYLNCLSNQLTSLDVSSNSSLKTFYCSDNQLTSLDVSSNSNLTNLSCSDNQLTSLDVSSNSNLTHLDCCINQITSLDVSNNSNLIELDCGGNQLTSLNVSNNSNLTYLDCGGNQLTSLNVSNNSNLTDLYCDEDVVIIR